MLTLRKAGERHHDRRGKHEGWLTFSPRNRVDPLADGFGVLQILDELRLAPGAGVPRRPRRDAEIVTYVREGVLAYEDSLGGSSIVRAGEFQCMTAARGARHSEANASRMNAAHVFQIWLRPNEAGRAPEHEQKRFGAGDRRGVLCVVASQDARRGSLRLQPDAAVFSTLLVPGQHVVHELSCDRSVWVHIVHGSASVNDVILSSGDGVGVTAERAVSLTALESTELLLVDLPGPSRAALDGGMTS